jgi:hypothetical protein
MMAWNGLPKITELGTNMTYIQFLVLVGAIYLSHEIHPILRQLIGLACLISAAYLGLTQ